MDFKMIQLSIFLIGILLITVEGKGNNWSAQGGNQWHVSDNPNYNPQTINHINQNGPGRVNTDNEEIAQYGQGRSWNPPENRGWGLQNIYGQNTRGFEDGFQQQSSPQGWTAGDSQVKDVGNQISGGNNQIPKRMWNPTDSQVKDQDTWNQQGNQNKWSPQDSQIKNDGGNQQNKNNWGPSDSQAKDSNKLNDGNNQGPSGNFDPSDSQRKDSDSWNARGSYPGNFGPNDAQAKDSNMWNNDRNQQPSRPFVPADAEEKAPGPWIDGGNQQNPDGWNPADGQVKDNKGWNRDGNSQGDGSRWGPGEGQMKINNEQSQDGDKDSSRGIWDQGQGPNIPGPNIDGGAGGGQWQPDHGPGQGLGGDWSADQGGINKPTVDQGPAIDIDQGRRDEGGYDSNRGQPDGVGIPDNGFGTEGKRDMGDTGVIPDGFPENNGRIPQGNYKGGDTGRYPGDDPSQWRLEDSIPGTPGEDYPNYSTIPQTGFDCKQHENPGYYGDVEAQCQVFHICQADGRHNSFLCPLGTIFNQQYFVCVWWFNYDCADTTMYYNLNADLYKGGHGGQGNFKGTPHGEGRSNAGPADSYTTPQSVDTGAIGDTGRTDYGSGPVDGRVDSIIPPGVGVENAGQTGIVGPVARPPVDNGVQPGDYGSNEGFGQTGQDLRPPVEQPMSVPQGTWYGQKPQQNVGPRPDTAVVPGGQNTGYDQGGENSHDGGKRNFGNEGSKRNWGIKGGSTSGVIGGRWNNEQDVMANNWENDSSKKGGYVKGRKARSWGDGSVYDSDVDKRWGSEYSNDQQGSWRTQEEVLPPPSTNQETNVRAGANENESQGRNWNTDSNEEKQRSYINGPSELARITDWESKQKNPESSEVAENWSNRKRENDLQETVDQRTSEQERNWRTIGNIPGQIRHERTQSIPKNWWRDSLGRSVEENGENWKEDTEERIQSVNKIQDDKDTPHTYGNWRNLDNYFDHDKEYNSEKNSEQQNWTK